VVVVALMNLSSMNQAFAVIDPGLVILTSCKRSGLVRMEGLDQLELPHSAVMSSLGSTSGIWT
jgi:hypothetical protein